MQALHSELRRWVDNKHEDAKQAQLVARVECLRGRHAVAIKYGLCLRGPPDLGPAAKSQGCFAQGLSQPHWVPGSRTDACGRRCLLI